MEEVEEVEPVRCPGIVVMADSDDGGPGVPWWWLWLWWPAVWAWPVMGGDLQTISVS